MSLEGLIARGFQLLLALTGAYTVSLWFALIVWTFRDIESRSRSVIAQIFSTLVVVLFFIPGVLIYLILRPRETLDEAFGRALEEEYLLQDLEDLSLCATCHRPVRDDFVACPHCYTELRRPCPACARLVDMVWAICPYCTADLAEDPADGDAQEAPWEEQRPALLPHPLRVLREQTEVRVRHSLDFGPSEAPRLAEGDAAQTAPLLTRETRESGSWADDTGKRSWILTRAREVFAPLLPTDPRSHTDGRDGANGGRRTGAEPDHDGHAPNGRATRAAYRREDEDHRAAAEPAVAAPVAAAPVAAPPAGGEQAGHPSGEQ